MVTDKGIPAGLIEATRLTRAGRLLEATALIQSALRGELPAADGAEGSASNRDGEASNDAIDGQFSRVADPDDSDATPLQQQPSADIPRQFGLESLVRGSRTRDSTLDLPRHGTTPADGRPGQFISGSYANQAGARPYRLYIPSSYTGQPLPLVVMLHGCTQSADDFANGTRMNALAEERQFLVLYPEQTHAGNHSRCWNWFRRGDQRRDQGEPAILAGMTREIVNGHGVDRSKVFVAGLSAGGAMAAVMGTVCPELYAAVGIHSGLACGSAHDVGSALSAMRGRTVSGRRNPAPLALTTPTIVFHGGRDKTVHPRNGQQLVAQSVEQSGASRTDATAERGQVPGGHAYTRTVYRDPTGRTVLEHWLVHEGGHAWFGGSPHGSYVDPKGPDAAREMIRFFFSSTAS
jgi:poly(hydroxyalkanoate) depolymerase family esterase